jgi:hypothetical protein
VKRLLRKYGYPPDLQDAAVQNVLQQAEALFEIKARRSSSHVHEAVWYGETEDKEGV